MLIDSSLVISREDYLRPERQADYKSEYHKGQVFAMAGAKFLYYQTIESLREYVLISQYPRRLEIYGKQADGAWLYRSLNEMPARLALESIDCRLDSADIYAKVDPESI